MKKLSKVEKYIIAISDPEEYNVFVCPEHGVYAIRKGDKNNTACSYCQKQGEKLDNQQDLFNRYRKELTLCDK